MTVSERGDRVCLIDIMLAVGLCITFVPYVYNRVGWIPSTIIVALWCVTTWGRDFSFIIRDRHFSATLFWIMLSMYVVASCQLTYSGSDKNAFVQVSIGTLTRSYVLWLIAQYYIVTRRFHRLKVITIAVLCAFLISSAMQLRMLLVDPFYSRIITGQGAVTADPGKVAEAMRMGVGGFDDIFAGILLAVPLVFASIHSVPPFRYLFLIVGALLMLTGLKASYMIGTLSMALAFLLVLIFMQKRIRPHYVIIALLVLVPMVQSGTRGVLADALDIVLRSTDLNWEYVQKIKIMQEALQTGTVSGGTRRFDLYAESIAGFLQNPLFGNVSGLCGGHSAILDSLARFGAIGTIPWLMVIYCVYRQMRQTLYPSNPNGVALGAVFLIPWIFTMVVDPSIGRRVYAAYFIILPGLSLFLIEGMQTKAHRCTRWGAAPIDTPQGGSSHRGHLSVSRV